MKHNIKYPNSFKAHTKIKLLFWYYISTIGLDDEYRWDRLGSKSFDHFCYRYKNSRINNEFGNASNDMTIREILDHKY